MRAPNGERNKQFHTACEKAGFQAYLGEKIFSSATEKKEKLKIF